MILHNTPATFTFLKHWRDSHCHFANIENLEQLALKLLALLPEFALIVHLHSWQSFHAYDLCNGYHSAFLLHFPGPHKVACVAHVLTWFDHHTTASEGLGSEQQSLTTLLGGLPSVETLAAELAKVGHNLLNPAVAIHNQACTWVESCLASAQSLGYDMEPYSETHNQRMLEYNMAGFFFNIPTIIYMTMPNATHIPEQVACNIDTWCTMNPDYQVVIYDDQGIKQLVQKFLDLAPKVWQSLLPMQKTNIWHYLVIYLFSSWYFDSDVTCIQPIRHWGHRHSNTLVIRIKLSSLRHSGPITNYTGQHKVIFTQYTFSATTRHPAIRGVLASILKHTTALSDIHLLASPNDHLETVLASTGPWAWTDTMATNLCYTDLYPDQPDKTLSTPHQFSLAGRQLVNTHMFNIASFGAGQQHSGSPQANNSKAGVNALHHFSGSKEFHSKHWTEVEARADKCTAF